MPGHYFSYSSLLLILLWASSTLSGLNAHEADTTNILKTLQGSNLNAAELKKLEAVIKQHGLTAEDINKLLEVVHKQRRNTDEADGRQGSDWLFDPDSEAKNARSHIPGHESSKVKDSKLNGTDNIKTDKGFKTNEADNINDKSEKEKHARSISEKSKDNDEEEDDDDDDKKKKHTRGISDNIVDKVKVTETPSHVDSTLFRAKRYCGFSPKVSDASNRLSNAFPGQFPWSAAILTQDDVFQCAGTLISDKLVLTTASCVLKFKQAVIQPAKVVLGAWSLPDGHLYLPEFRVYVRAAVIHPGYSVDNPQTHIHDVGVLQLQQSIDFDLYPHIFPVCIIGPPFESYASTTQCRITGWPELPHLEPWRSATHLNVGDVKIDTNACAGTVNSNLPCAIGNACVGNQGSPVICLTDSQRYYQWGILAVEPNCNRQTATSVQIVNVIQNYDFIKKHL